MNRYLFIGLIVFVLVAVLGLWAYLILNGTPRSTSDVFTNLGLGTETTDRPANDLDQQTTTVDTNSQKLNQLTTRPVAGYQLVNTASSSNTLTYAERGTGHIYQIDMTTGTETRISGTTLNRVVKATFSVDGEWVVLTTETDYDHQSYVEYLASTSSNPTLAELPENSADHTWQNDTLFYTQLENGVTNGYQYDPDTQSASLVFTTPLRDITAYWQGINVFLVNEPAHKLRGALYQLGTTGQYQLLRGPEYGFTAFSEQPGQWFVSSIDTETQQYRSYTINTTDNSLTPLALVVIPEKCASQSSQYLWCMLPYLEETNADYLSSWYRGEPTYADKIWRIDTTNGDARFVLDPTQITGFDIDADNVQMTGTYLLFTNRHNDTLWSYDTQ